MPEPRVVVALFGPTGVGKTAVALALARLLRARGDDPVAVSADALQVYAGLEVLSGAATTAERAELDHRLVGVVPITQAFSVGEYMPRAHAEIDAALRSRRRPIVVGGTGLYLRAALTELDLRPAPPPELRAALERRLHDDGPEGLHADLAARAPWAAGAIAPGDRSRLIRAVELLELDALRPPDGASQLWTAETRRPTLLVGLTMERAALYRRIDARVDAMVAAGAEAEVRAAVAAGASPTAEKALGFRELLAGDVEGMKRRTRNYARRQLTWMRKLAAVETLDTTGRDGAEAAGAVLALLDRRESAERPTPTRRRASPAV